MQCNDEECCCEECDLRSPSYEKTHRQPARTAVTERAQHSLVLCPLSCFLRPGIKPGFRSSTSRRPPSDQMAYAPPDYPPLQYETRPVNFRDHAQSDEYQPHSTQSPEVATTFTHTSGITIPYSGQYVHTCTRYHAHLFPSRVRIHQRAGRDASTGSSSRICPQEYIRNSTRPVHAILSYIRKGPTRFPARRS